MRAPRTYILACLFWAMSPSSGNETGDPEPDDATELKAIGAHVFFDPEGVHVIEVSANHNAKLRDSHLGTIASFREITDLSLEGTAVSDKGLAKLGRLPKLEWLNLFQTGVGDEGLWALSKIRSLKMLPIGGTKVTDAGLKHAGAMLQLEYLGLRGNAVGDKGVAFLAGLENLKGLHLGETEVGDAGVKHLSGMKRLEKLWLHDTKIGDGAVPALLELKGLKELHLQNTGITEAAAAGLREGLPKCEVRTEWDGRG